MPWTVTRQSAQPDRPIRSGRVLAFTWDDSEASCQFSSQDFWRCSTQSCWIERRGGMCQFRRSMQHLRESVTDREKSQVRGARSHHLQHYGFCLSLSLHSRRVKKRVAPYRMWPLRLPLQTYRTRLRVRPLLPCRTQSPLPFPSQP